MTSRINRYKAEYHGSTIKAIEQPDFLTTLDPWFRPVDLQIGPDGAMYILDFYNRIIGHYEVPLPHPGRDRTSGRIWRVVYKGDDAATTTAKPLDLLKFSNEQLLEHLATHGDDLEAFSLLRDRGQSALPDIRIAWNKPYSQKIISEILWLLEANGALTADDLLRAEFRGSPRDRTHLARVLAERKDWAVTDRNYALGGLMSSNPFVIRASADAIGRHPKPEQLRDLLSCWKSTATADNHLRHTLRMAVRDHIAALTSTAALDALKLNDDQLREVASVCLAVPAPIAAAILVPYIEKHDDNTLAYLQHAARYADSQLVPEVVRVGRAKVGSDIEFQAQVIQSLANGLAQRGDPVVGELIEWAQAVATSLLASSDSDHLAWTAVSIDGLPPSENPWVIAPRPSRDGDKDSLFYYSLPKGEQRTGIYRSAPFAISEKLSFWCAGHSGIPNQPLNNGNYIRLRDAKTNEILAESRPPRNDTARQFNWDLSKHLKREGEAPAEPRLAYIDLVDGDTGNAYAWLAVGRFSLAALNASDAPHKQQLAAEIIGKLKLTALKSQLTSLVAQPETANVARTAIAQALLAFDPDARAAALVAALADPLIPDDLRPKIGQAIASQDDALYLDCLREVMRRAATRLQSTLAETLAGDSLGANLLLALIESGHAAPRLLLLPNVSSKLGALNNAGLDQRAAAITSKLPAPSAILDALITDRRRAFAQAKTNPDRGQSVFTKHCAACHQVEGKGVVLGPQLDGIGNRGLDRLLEDVLDPNRNVDVAFLTTTLRLTDGRVLSGLIRREEGTQLVLADAQGKEFTVAKADIDEQQKTSLSLMPANVGEIVPAEEFFDLLAYLLAKRAAPQKLKTEN